MSTNFVSWEEHIICHERGSRVVHYYLKDTFGDLELAVIGTERSIRHMIYVVSDEFINVYGSKRFSVNASTKWRARREVVEWLTSVVSKCQPRVGFSNLRANGSPQDCGSLDLLTTGIISCQTYLTDPMVLRKLKVQKSDIEWFGVAWICAKQLKHYPSFRRNGTTIAVHSLVFIMAEEGRHYIGYLEDMYEDKKGQKKVKVRWFHHNEEVRGVIPGLNPHPAEVFITANAQVISAECVDGLATVLTPTHYEKCLDVVPHISLSSVHICFRQIKDNKVKPFAIAKLRGYSNQAILSALGCPPIIKQKAKYQKLNEEGEDQLTLYDPVRVGAKRNRRCKEQEGLECGFAVKYSPLANQITSGEPKYPKLKLRLSRKTMGIKVVLTQPQCPMSFKVNDRIEMLCQDSGIRGCWFRCKVLRASRKHLKVEYDDVEDADGPGNLKEWIPAFRIAAPDKLGMRILGRSTVRPCPPDDSRDFKFEVGAPVDAWCSDGWWEGVVTGVDISGNDYLQVYLPGENKFGTVQRKNARVSKDWVGNKWVDIRPNPDILSYVSANFSHSLKLADGCGSTALLCHKVLTASKLETVQEDEEELAGSDLTDELKNMREVNMRKRRGKDDDEENVDHENDDKDNELFLEDDIKFASQSTLEAVEALKALKVL